ncbi:hypothetical protein EV363DRAFT_1224222 [Boletus edulis]|uniref:DUF6533 domain-containing protein n=1 Tax=Boletus edulis BED1 TaxID=1328754 RepID=A0AAD4GMI5_BOLED|nr:hypothetical protein EV363DRAFT_1224222 [Boletus edulis]KAF8452752.1 hypothetical protein L210DRAFT_3755753 [Boletus edulis BED1]
MSTSLAVDLESLYLNNCVSLVMVAAVTYDYLLTFSDEIEYIWKRRWTWVSTVFLLVRYMGLLTTLYGHYLIDHHFALTLSIIKALLHWMGPPLYLVLLVMVFRMYALYGQSKGILTLLLFLYAGEVAVSMAGGIIYSKPGALLVFIPPAPDPSVCIVQYPSWNWGRYSAVPLVVLQGVMCLLAIFGFSRQALQLYKGTRRWQFNKYINLLVHQGILYFIINFLRAVVTQGLFSLAISQTAGLILTTTAQTLIFTLNSRFILSIRELYAQSSYSQGIDTGFEDVVEEVPMGELRRKRYVDGI